MVKSMRKEIEIPEDVKITVEGRKIVFEGPKGKIERGIFHPLVSAKVEDNKVILETPKDDRKNKRILNTWVAHVKNDIKGVREGYEYQLKVVYTHFPMTVKVEGDKVVIQNFAGERSPRYAKILPGVEVKVNKQDITVSGIDLWKVSQTAANLENATRVTGRDRRIFQDGIYIVKKGK